MHRFRLVLILLATALALQACSRATSVESTLHTAVPAQPYSRILVLAVSKDLTRRQRFESVTAAALRESGNTAWPSTNYMDSIQELNRETVGAAARKANADAVLVMRIISQDISTEEVESRTGVKTERRSDHVYDFFRYDYNEYQEPGYTLVKNTVTMNSDLYEAAEGELIISVKSVTYEKESEFEIFDEASVAIAKRLQREGMIR